MPARRFGILMMAVGATLVAVTLLSYALSGPNGDDAAVSATTVPSETAVTTEGSVSPPTSESPQPSPTTAPSTTTTTTTTLAPTTTTLPAETLEGFVEAFAAALEDGDTEFVWSRLHPQVIENGGEQLCRDWVEREIMGLSDYTLFEVTDGPRAIGGIPDVYTASVSFIYEGQVFDDGVGQFALLDGQFHWLGACR